MKNNLLLKTNFRFTLFLILINVFFFFIFPGNKNSFTLLSIVINCCFFFLYNINLSDLIDKYWLSIKKELFYINYPLLISGFLIFLFLILISNIIIIGILNKEALNSASVLTFFVSTFTLFLPSLLFLLYIYIVNPALILPSFEKKKPDKKLILFLLTLFMIFLLLSLIKIITDSIDNLNITNKDKFKISKLVMRYSDKYLNYSNLTEERVHILSADTIKIPLYHTSNGYKYRNYKEAEYFCRSINARIPNHYEIYNIIFNKFEIFGDQYYWTNDFAGKNNLVLHFKNMSYEVKIKPKNITPIVYCVSDDIDNYSNDTKYFYRIMPIKQKNKIEKKNSKEYTFPPDINQIFMNNNSKENLQTQESLPSVLRHVNFSVKHVSEDIFNKLLEEGYNYNKLSKANSYYETSDLEFSKKINTDSDIKKINLCYFPYTDYSNLSRQNEIELWKQSFCSPSFEVIQETAVLKSGYEKDAYCMAKGGRIPNIPELTAILKKYKLNNQSLKYWTNVQLSNITMGEKQPAVIQYKDYNFIMPELQNKSDKAYTFCIKSTEPSSKIITNFQSRFYNEDGKKYAQRICPSCIYYEMPDTVLLQ